ncbi:GerAB/ArcD/ProY family transporter [Ectobacillus funiculus]
MNHEKIGIKQLFLLMLAFEIGTAIIFSIGTEAKQDSWLAVLVGMLYGVILILIFTTLCEYYPNNSLIQIIQIIWKVYWLSIVYYLYYLFYLSRCED